MPQRLVTSLTTLLAVLTLIACTASPVETPSHNSPTTSPTAETPTPSAATTVTDDGFSVQLSNGATATGGAGVAPVGTPVSAELTTPVLPTDFGFAVPLGEAIDLTLGAGLQPDGPIRLTLPVPANADPERVFVLAESSDSGRDVEFVDSFFDPVTQTVTVITDHLSWYTVTQVDDEGLVEQFGKWAGSAVGMRSDKPSCVDEPDPRTGGYVLAEPWPTVAWVCATTTVDGSLDVTLYSNSGLVYSVTTDPDGQWQLPTATNLSDIAINALIRRLEADGLTDAALVHGSTARIIFENAHQATIRLELNAALSQLSTIMMGVRMLAPPGSLDTVEWFECVVGVVDTVDDGLSGAQVKSMLECVAVGAKGAGGDLLGLILSAPGALLSQLEGLGRTTTGATTEEFTVTLVSGDAVRELPDGATWLFDLADGGTFTGGQKEQAQLAGLSYPFSTNQWVGCHGDVAQTEFDLNGQYAEMSLDVALQDHTPDGLRATYSLVLDDEMKSTTSVTKGERLARSTIDVRGVSILRIEMHTDDDCGTASKGYASLVQSYVR